MAARAAGRRLGARQMVGLAFVALGAAALADLWVGGLSIWDESGPGASFFPLILSLLLAVLGAAFAWSRPSNQGTESACDAQDGTALRPQTLKFVLLLTGLILVFHYLGGLLSLSIFVFAEMRWVERSSTWMSLTMGAVAFIAVWVIFVKVLSVPLPVGILPASFG